MGTQVRFNKSLIDKWTKVTVSRKISADDATSWCNICAHGRWTFDDNLPEVLIQHKIDFYFKNKKDAILYKIIFG